MTDQKPGSFEPTPITIGVIVDRALTLVLNNLVPCMIIALVPAIAAVLPLAGVNEVISIVQHAGHAPAATQSAAGVQAMSEQMQTQINSVSGIANLLQVALIPVNASLALVLFNAYFGRRTNLANQVTLCFARYLNLVVPMLAFWLAAFGAFLAFFLLVAIMAAAVAGVFMALHLAGLLPALAIIGALLGMILFIFLVTIFHPLFAFGWTEVCIEGTRAGETIKRVAALATSRQTRMRVVKFGLVHFAVTLVFGLFYAVCFGLAVLLHAPLAGEVVLGVADLVILPFVTALNVVFFTDVKFREGTLDDVSAKAKRFSDAVPVSA